MARPPAHNMMPKLTRGSTRAPVDPELDERWVEKVVGGKITLVRNQLFTSPSGISRRNYAQYLVKKDDLAAEAGHITHDATAAVQKTKRPASSMAKPAKEDGRGYLPPRPRSSLAAFDPEKAREQSSSPVKRPASSIGFSHKQERGSKDAAGGLSSMDSHGQQPRSRPDSSISTATTAKRPASSMSLHSRQSSRPGTGISRILVGTSGSPERPGTTAGRPTQLRQKPGIFAMRSGSSSVAVNRSSSSIGGPSPRKGESRSSAQSSKRPVVVSTGGGLQGVQSLTMIESVLTKEQMEDLRKLLSGINAEVKEGSIDPNVELEKSKKRVLERKSSIRRGSLMGDISSGEKKDDGTGVNIWASTKRIQMPVDDEGNEQEYVPNAFENLKTIRGKPSGKRFWVDRSAPQGNNVSTASAFKIYGKLRSKQVQATTKIFDEKEFIKGLLHQERYQGQTMANAEVWLAGVDTLLDKRAQLREFERVLQGKTHDLKEAEHDVKEIEGSIKVSIAGGESVHVTDKLRSDLEVAKKIVEKKKARQKVALTTVEMHMVSVDEVESLMASRKNNVETKLWDDMKEDLLVPQTTQEQKDHQTRVMQSAIDEMRRGWWNEDAARVMDSAYKVAPAERRRLVEEESSDSGIAEDDGESDDGDGSLQGQTNERGGYFARAHRGKRVEDVQLRKEVERALREVPNKHWGKGVAVWERKATEDEERLEELQSSQPADTADRVEKEALHIMYQTAKNAERRQREIYQQRLRLDVALWPSKGEVSIKLDAMVSQGGDLAKFAQKILEKAHGKEGTVMKILQQMRFPGLSKALHSWIDGHTSVQEAKCNIIDAFHNVCMMLKVPAAGSSLLDSFVFSNTQDSLLLTGLNWSSANMAAFAALITGRDLTGCDRALVPLMRLREKCDVPLLTHLMVDNNSIRADGAALLAQAIISSRVPLKSLDISNCDLGHLGAAAIVDLLCAPDVPLETLVADSNGLGDGGVAAIADVVPTGSLVRLSLRRNMAGRLSGRSLGSMLADTETLQQLDMSWNEIRGEAAVRLAEGLASNRSVKMLKLAWNAFGDSKPMSALAHALSDCVVEDLDLAENRLGPKSCFIFAACFEHNSLLKHVVFDGNPITVQGARELLRCATHGKDGKDVMRTFSLERCAMGTIAPSVYNPSEPAGFYSLDMSDSSNVRILRILIRHRNAGEGKFENPTLVVATKDGETRRPFHMDAFPQGSTEDQWILPSSGHIEVSFCDTREAPKGKVELGDDLMHSLRQQLMGNIETNKKVDVVQAAVGMSFMSQEQMVELLSYIPESATQERVNLVCKCYHRLSDLDDPRKVLELLATEERHLVEKQLGSASFTFFRNNPTGYHRVDLSKPAQREVLLRLIGLKNSMAEAETEILNYYAKRPGAPRDVESIGLSWRNGTFNNSSIPYSQAWSVPYGGKFTLDFTDVRKPGELCAPMSEEEFQQNIMGKWSETSALLGLHLMSPNNKVRLLREVTNSNYVNCEQVAKMIRQFNPFTTGGIRVEILVACWARTVDWHGLSNVMMLLTPFEQKVLENRLGSVNVFDELMAVGYYDLDFSLKTDRFVFAEVLHLSVSEPGDNLLHVTFNTLDFVIPAGWTTGQEPVPNKGKISFFFVRSAEVHKSLVSQGAYGGNSKPPPPHSLSTYAEPWWKSFCDEGMISPTGSDWVYPYRCRRIRHKLAEKFEAIEHCFCKLDTDGGGFLDRKEVTAGLFNLGIWLHPQESKQLVEQLDEDGSGEISIVEFQKFWTQFA